LHQAMVTRTEIHYHTHKVKLPLSLWHCQNWLSISRETTGTLRDGVLMSCEAWPQSVSTGLAPDSTATTTVPKPHNTENWLAAQDRIESFTISTIISRVTRSYRKQRIEVQKEWSKMFSTLIGGRTMN
jgi:hypothetical protein